MAEYFEKPELEITDKDTYTDCLRNLFLIPKLYEWQLQCSDSNFCLDNTLTSFFHASAKLRQK